MSAAPKWTGGRWELGIGKDGAWFIMGEVRAEPADADQDASTERLNGVVICFSEAANSKHNGYLLLMSKDMYRELVATVTRCPSPGCADCLRIEALLRRARGEDDDVDTPKDGEPVM